MSIVKAVFFCIYYNSWLNKAVSDSIHLNFQFTVVNKFGNLFSSSHSWEVLHLVWHFNMNKSYNFAFTILKVVKREAFAFIVERLCLCVLKPGNLNILPNKINMLYNIIAFVCNICLWIQYLYVNLNTTHCSYHRTYDFPDSNPYF